MKKINPLIRWWVTPKLPYEDVWAPHSFFSKWLFHPIKRRLARWYIRLLQKFTNIKVIGITGSSGKTTTTQILAGILKQDGETVCSKEGVDSVYNIPNTILRCTPKTKYLILEMSVEYPGEMDFYLWLVSPDIGVITNIFSTHTLYFGDENGVAKEKSKLISSLSKSKIAVLNSTNKYTKRIGDNSIARVFWFKEQSDPILSNIEVSKVVASTLSIKDEIIDQGLKTYNKPKHRFNIFNHKSGALVFDDSYNSNPEAFISALKLFVKTAGKKKLIGVFGDMLELGEKEVSEHKRVGKIVDKYNFKAIIGVGEQIKLLTDEVDHKKTKIYLVENYNQVLDLLKPFLNKNSAVFIKGSRSIHLDKVADELV